MKTIEERARLASPYERFEWQQGYYIYEGGYIQGAEEQRAIDIEKACEWLKKYCGMNESGLVQFRKAMEE